MKILLLVVGKTTDAHIQTLVADYAKRVGYYVSFDIEVIPELRNTRGLSEEQQKSAEGEQIRQALKPGDTVILLDEHGTEFRSMEYATWLQKKMASGARRLVFVVGGPYGFSPEVYALAAGKISLSRMTFSHQMVRLFFVEQLYRAQTILKGEPYHHE